MYRIRLHGRGGQGIKTAGRILGTAFFIEGFEVQDAPRYGAERRGAPIFAYVRACRSPIYERGIIRDPDLIVTADDGLMSVPAADVLSGAAEDAILLLYSDVPAGTWKERVNFPGRVITLPDSSRGTDSPHAGAMCSGAAARLVGVISVDALKRAIREELSALGKEMIERNLDRAMSAYDLMAEYAGCVREGAQIPADAYEIPEWVDMPFECARVAAPAIHAAATSVAAKTGLWRTMRPFIHYHRCRRCWWTCSTLCPDGVINLNKDGYPEIDYEHCKGCMVCAAGCLRHAIEVVPEHEMPGAGAP
jgi:pyruvate ferredoxin oxidoreductase gamma subunit